MGTESRRTDPPLSKRLFDEAYRFEVFQAVRLLERAYPEREPVGRDGDPSREVVRFRTQSSLAFPASQLHDLAAGRGDGEECAPEMTVAFMGLTGPLGLLPAAYTELLIERARQKDTALWEFLDLFNHRMISFFYRAWEKYRFPVAYERGEQDTFTECLYDIVGMGTPGLRGRTSVEDTALLFYGGHVAQRPRSASAIEAVLGDYFGVPARVEQFSGQWLKLDDESLTRLGGANSRLGEETVVGTRVWDTQAKFRLRFGPLTLEQFKQFLPIGSAFNRAGDFARLLAGMEFDFDIQLTLKAEEVPGCAPASLGAQAPMLGWTTWLKTKDFTDDDSQVVLNAEKRHEREH